MRGRNLLFSRFAVGTLIFIFMFGFAGDTATALAAGDGFVWSALGSGMGGFPFQFAPGVIYDARITALAVAPDGTVYVGGEFSTAGGVSAEGIAKWNGTTWSALGVGLRGGVSALAIAPDGTLYAAGDVVRAADGSADIGVVKWNGTTWSSLEFKNNAKKDYTQSKYITALTVAPDGTLYVGGEFTTAGGVSANHIAKWSGNTWSSLGTGMNANKDSGLPVFALAVASDGTLYAGGNFHTAGGVNANNIAKWNGTVWSSVGSGMDTKGGVSALAVAPDGCLYAGGGFVTAGGVKANCVARWNGTTWTALGAGVDPRYGVAALAIAHDGTLYAGGLFDRAGQTKTECIAKWNGSSWSALGAGLSDRVVDLALAPNGTLYAVGLFEKSGKTKVNYVAKWGPQY